MAERKTIDELKLEVERLRGALREILEAGQDIGGLSMLTGFGAAHCRELFELAGLDPR